MIYDYQPVKREVNGYPVYSSYSGATEYCWKQEGEVFVLRTFDETDAKGRRNFHLCKSLRFRYMNPFLQRTLPHNKQYRKKKRFSSAPSTKMEIRLPMHSLFCRHCRHLFRPILPERHGTAESLLRSKRLPCIIVIPMGIDGTLLKSSRLKTATFKTAKWALPLKLLSKTFAI